MAFAPAPVPQRVRKKKISRRSSARREAKRDYDRSSWDYELDEQRQVKADETLQHPRCVFQLMKQHDSRYTPEMVERITGSPRDKLMSNGSPRPLRPTRR
jgi:anaerobic selenocysteine-containing dehydrogenase